MDVKIETEISITVKVRGTYTPGAKPLPMRGEAVAVECPGWDEGVDDLDVVLEARDKYGTLRCIELAEFLDAETIESLESELRAAARDELERRGEP